MVLFTDENANIDGGTAPFINLPMCENDETLMPELPPGRTTGEIGSGENTLVYANHIHPFDGRCFEDAEYQSFLIKRDDANLKIERKLANDNTIRISSLLDIVIDVVAAMMIGTIPFSAAFVNVIIMILNASYNLGIREIDVDGVTHDISKVIETIRAKYQ